VAVRPARPALVRSWPQAASMPTPRLARMLTGTPVAATAARKRRAAARDGASKALPGVGL
jgi:hypothetical protein